MSAVSSRSRVHSVSGVLIVGAFAGAAFLVRGLVSAVASSLESASREDFNRVRSAKAATGVATIASETGLRDVAGGAIAVASASVSNHVSPVEAVKVSTLLQIDRSDCWAQDRAAVRNGLKDLVRASDYGEAVTARRSLLQTLQSEHGTVFVESLTAACRNACTRLGFDQIDAVPSTLVDQHRLVASHASGRSLVVEVHTDERGDTSLATEVLGVHDGTCSALLDAFDEALDAQGVKSDTPDRKFTGGVCELAATREFVRRRVLPANRAPRTQTTEKSARRKTRRPPAVVETKAR